MKFSRDNRPDRQHWQGRGRTRLTPIESRLGSILRRLKLGAWSHYHAGGFEVDFVLHDYLVGVEADGELYHSSLEAAKRRDVKDAWFGARGYRILHLTGSVIMNDAPLVIQLIQETIAGAQPRPPTPVSKLRLGSQGVVEAAVTSVDATRSEGERPVRSKRSRRRCSTTGLEGYSLSLSLADPGVFQSANGFGFR